MKVKCTQCGGDVTIEHDSGFVVCPYCESSLYIEVDQSVRHYYLQPILAPEGLAPYIQRSLTRLELKRPVKVTGQKLVYFPFWQLHSRSEEKIVMPAATALIEDLAELDMPVGEQRYYDKSIGEKAEVIQPEMLLDTAMSRLKITGQQTDIVRSDLIHLPMYFFSYEYRGRPFRAAMDAVSGRVYADQYPPSPSRAKDRFFAAILIIVFLLFLAEGIAVPGFGYTILAYIATSLLLYPVINNLLKKRGW